MDARHKWNTRFLPQLLCVSMSVERGKNIKFFVSEARKNVQHEWRKRPISAKLLKIALSEPEPNSQNSGCKKIERGLENELFQLTLHAGFCCRPQRKQEETKVYLTHGMKTKTMGSHIKSKSLRFHKFEFPSFSLDVQGAKYTHLNNKFEPLLDLTPGKKKICTSLFF